MPPQTPALHALRSGAFSQGQAVFGVALPQTVLILGARGRLGYACVRAFAQAGWQVVAQVRADSMLPNVTGNQGADGIQVHWVAADIDDAKVWKACARRWGGIAVVINALAPKFTIRTWARELPCLTQTGIDAARLLQARLIHPLSILSAGAALPCIWLESAGLPPAATSALAILRLATEQQLAHAAQQGVRICTLRTGTFYGHSGWGWVSTAIAKDLRKGRMDWLGPYDVATPWAYVPDVAQTMVAIAQQHQDLPVWAPLHFAGHVVTGQDWAQALQTVASGQRWIASGKALRCGRVQWWMWQPAAWLSPSIRALSAMEYVWRTPHSLDNTHLRQWIGSEPRTPWPVSVAHTVELLDKNEDLHGGLVRTHAGF